MMSRDYEWDEVKRLSNIKKHGIDFIDAPNIFERDHLEALARREGDEER